MNSPTTQPWAQGAAISAEALPSLSVPSGGDDWVPVLSRLAEATGLEADPERLRAAAARAARADSASFADALIGACEDLGLCARRMRGTIADAAQAVGPEHPIAVRDPRGVWLAVTDRSGRSLRVEAIEAGGEAEWVREGALSERLDPEHAGTVEWVALDPPGLLYSPEGPASASGSAGAPSVPSPWVRLRRLLRRERHDVLVTLVYAIGVGLLTLATPIAVQALVNTVAFGTLLQPLAALAFLLLLGLAFAGVLRALQAWVVEVLQRRLFVRLVDELSRRLPHVELSALDRAHGPELVNRFFDLFTIQKAASTLLIDGLEILLTACVGMLVLAFYHPLLLAFDAVLVAIVLGILLGLGRGATESAVQESKAKYEVASWLEEVARHPEAFKLAGGPALARRRADELAATYLRRRAAHFSTVFRQLGGALLLQAFASAGILGIGGWLVIERQLTLGQLVAAELIVTMVVASFAKIGKHLETAYDLLAALDKVGQLLDLPIEDEVKSAQLPASAPSGARLSARGLRFGFEGRADLFSEVDLELAPGDRVVLSGKSGAGRSALVDVLLGLRRAREGRIEIDGLDLRDLDRRSLRERTALVRGAEVVAGSLVENVAFGRDEIDLPRIREALRAVDLLDEVARLPEGLSTRITPDGGPLSRGQAARLVIARAIAARPSLLIVDRAVDGLDEHTREPVLKALFSQEAPWTLLLISDHPDVRRRCARGLRLLDGHLHEDPDVRRDQRGAIR